MLDFMRRNARSWGIKVALGIICVVFVFFMGGGGSIGRGTNMVATVGDSEISINDFQRLLTSNRSLYREQYGGDLPDELARALDIPSRTLSQLIDGALLGREAKRLGLFIPDEALRAAMRQVPAFQRNGSFSPSQYKATLARQGTSPGAFEDSMRTDMLVAQLADLLRTGVQVSDEEVFADFLRDNESVTLSYIKVESAPLASEVVVEAEPLKDFFTEKAENYRLPEMVDVAYLKYSAEDFTKEAAPGEESIEEYYLLNKESEFKVREQVGARHILKKVATDAGDDEKAAARAALEKAREELEGGADFAELARELSDDGSAANGGDLGLFGRGTMVPPFEEAAFALAVGETSEVVETAFGYHLIKVYRHSEPRTKSIEEVRNDIVAKLSAEAARDLAFDSSAADAAQAGDEGLALADLAAARGSEIETTGLVGRGEIVPSIGSAPGFVDAALALAADKVSDPVRVGEVYYLLEPVRRRDSRLPALEEVGERVEADFRKDRALELARAKAEGLLEALGEGTTLEELAARHSLETADSQELKRSGSFVKGLGNVAGLRELAFRTGGDDQALPRVFLQRGDAYVFVRKSRAQAAREDFDERKDELTDRLKRRKEDEVLSAFVADLKRETEISYNQEALNRIIPR